MKKLILIIFNLHIALVSACLLPATHVVAPASAYEIHQHASHVCPECQDAGQSANEENHNSYCTNGSCIFQKSESEIPSQSPFLITSVFLKQNIMLPVMEITYVPRFTGDAPIIEPAIKKIVLRL
jgi:hypothetical protein